MRVSKVDPEVRRIVLAGRLIIVLAFGGLGLWLAVAPLKGAVIALGQVKVERYRKVVQHNEGGIVKEVLVRDGDRVARGQPLLLLDDIQAGAALSVVRGALEAELARHVRLQTEAAGAAEVAFPPELQGPEATANARQMVARERDLFQAQRRAMAEQVRLLGQQTVEIEREVAALSSQRDAEERARQLAEEELGRYTALHDRQFISATRLMEQKRLVADYLSRREERRAEIARAQRLREEVGLRAASLRIEQARAATEELKDSSARVADLRERLRPSQDAVRRLTVTAPVEGRVIGLRVHTPGGAIGPRDPLMEIVPDEAPLMIEARVAVDAIKELRPGQVAQIRFPALPYRTTPLVAGTLRYISADALADDNGAAFYQIQVVPEATSLKAAGIAGLEPGMAAEVFVETQSRTALEYLLQPVTDALRRGFRER